MNDFWKSYDITHAEYGADYRCYPLYGTVHLMELAISLAFRGGGPVVSPQFCPHPAAHFSRSHRFAPAGRSCPSAGDGPDRPVELELSAPAPVQCLYNTITDRNWCKEELYALCIPGAMLALLCPSWLDVPSWWTLINLHSVSIHALLVLYPVLLVAGGYRPSPRRVPQVLAFLFGSALPIYILNKSLNTNF